jgi:hypothetical protein
MIHPKVNVAEDIALIKQGKGFIKDKTITVNNRTYGIKDDGLLFPMEGEGFVLLSAKEITLIKVIKQNGSVEQGLVHIRNMKDVTEDQIVNVLKLLEDFKKQ